MKKSPPVIICGIIGTILNYLLKPELSFLISYTTFCFICLFIIRSNREFLNKKFGKYPNRWKDEILLSISLFILFSVLLIESVEISIIFFALLLFSFSIIVLFLFSKSLSKLKNPRLNPEKIEVIRPVDDESELKAQRIQKYLKLLNEKPINLIIDIKRYERNRIIYYRALFTIVYLFSLLVLFTAFFFLLHMFFLLKLGLNNLSITIIITVIEYIILKSIDYNFQIDKEDNNLYEDLIELGEKTTIRKVLVYLLLILPIILLNTFSVLILSGLVEIFSITIVPNSLTLFEIVRIFIRIPFRIIMAPLCIYIFISTYRKILISYGLDKDFKNSKYYFPLAIISFIYCICISLEVYFTMRGNYFFANFIWIIFILFLVGYFISIKFNKIKLRKEINKSTLIFIYIFLILGFLIFNMFLFTFMAMVDINNTFLVLLYLFMILIVSGVFMLFYLFIVYTRIGQLKNKDFEDSITGFAFNFLEDNNKANKFEEAYLYGKISIDFKESDNVYVKPEKMAKILYIFITNSIKLNKIQEAQKYLKELQNLNSYSKKYIKKIQEKSNDFGKDKI